MLIPRKPGWKCEPGWKLAPRRLRKQCITLPTFRRNGPMHKPRTFGRNRRDDRRRKQLGVSATGAAQSQYRPPKCNPKHEECTCPGGSIRESRDRCVCPAGQTFAEGTNDCRCPNGSNPTDGKCGKCPDHQTEIDGKCVPPCPDGSVRADSGRCVCPDHGTLVDGRCVRRRHPRAIPQSAASTVRTTRSPKHR